MADTSVDSTEELAAVLVGRTVTAVEWHRGGDWGYEAAAYFTLDDGTTLEMLASGWHGSGAVSFYVAGAVAVTQ